MDEATWNRARGWALWKALITYDAKKDSDKVTAKEAFITIQTIVKDYKKI
ncbi:aminoglycoside phosphotransferase (APT) family kinase protein [Peribacillus deserti]|uniref:Aminoglycoside phosphotransferase (APT) family kinase protein n=1 Tax=Peribacillus deserti TaxID=673318 RepID=A0ABS2QNV5_9BACI|nr:aminoglycoside phosphotransferase (APT) family kinase protein [Peribacillus deserti]